jgi:hypothetical protein
MHSGLSPERLARTTFGTQFSDGAGSLPYYQRIYFAFRSLA